MTEIQIKIIIRHYSPSTRVVKIWKTDNVKCWRIWSNWYIESAEGNPNCVAILESNLAVSYKVKHTIKTQYSNSTLQYLFIENENICLHKDLILNIMSNFMHNSTKLDSTQMWLMNKQERLLLLLSNIGVYGWAVFFFLIH